MGLKDSLRKAGKDKLWDGKTEPELLLSGNIPAPMHGMAPRVVLGSKWWNTTRKEAYLSTDYHCLTCGVHKERAKGPKWLEGHELYEIDFLTGRMTYKRTVPLCHYCHNYIHIGRLQALLDSGEIRQSTFVAIIRYGDRVLEAANLLPGASPLLPGSLLDGEPELMAQWGDWRLVVNGKEYPPKYKTQEDWEKAFEHGQEKEEG